MARPANTYRAARRNLVIRTNGLLRPPAYQDANRRSEGNRVAKMRALEAEAERRRIRNSLVTAAAAGRELRWVL